MSDEIEMKWWLIVEDEQKGPYSTLEIKSMIDQGNLDGNTMVSDLSGTTCRDIKHHPEFGVLVQGHEQPGDDSSDSSFSWRSYWKFALFGFVLLGIKAYFGLLPFTDAKKPPAPSYSIKPFNFGPNRNNKPQSLPGINNNPASGNSQPTSSTRVARLSFAWRDGTNELIAMSNRLDSQQRALLGFTALASGMDIYAARVTLRNTGNVPIRVFPTNISIQYRGESARVYSSNSSPFLEKQVLQPGASTSGLVTYTARMDIGAAIRTGSGTMAYADPTIEVTYD